MYILWKVKVRIVENISYDHFQPKIKQNYLTRIWSDPRKSGTGIQIITLASRMKWAS